MKKQKKSTAVKEPLITFNDIPRVLGEMMTTMKQLAEGLSTLETIEKKVAKMEKSSVKGEKKQWLSITELTEYLPSHPKVSTVYSWTRENKIPFHKDTKSILFSTAEIDEWIKQNKLDVSESLAQKQAEEYIKTHPKK